MTRNSKYYIKCFTSVDVMKAITMFIIQLLNITRTKKLMPSSNDSYLVSCVKSTVYRHFVPDQQILASSTGKGNEDLRLTAE